MTVEKPQTNDCQVFIEPDTHDPNAIIGPRTNNYLYNKCQAFLSIFKWFPVLFIFGVLTWGYYAYVIQLCILTLESIWLQVPFVSIFHFLYFMCVWSYYKTIFSKPTAVPKQFWLTYAEFNKLISEPTDEAKNSYLLQLSAQKQLFVVCRTFVGAVRLCTKCNLIKPDRAHHCSVCNVCVLKMDHHCPWVNNCISFSNYKYFILFLGYSFSMCLWSAATSFNYFLQFWSNQLPTIGKFNILFLFFVSLMFCISLFSLFSYHIYLVLMNRSTLESFSPPVFINGPNKNAYNLGKFRNFKQVFGNEPLYWFFPIYTSKGNGVEFENFNNLQHRSRPDSKPLLSDYNSKMTDDDYIDSDDSDNHILVDNRTRSYDHILDKRSINQII